MSSPATLATPDVFRRRVVRILIVVLFPAPFGPRNPKNSPSSTLKDILLTACVPSPYVFTRFSTWTAGNSLNLYRIRYIASDTGLYKEFFHPPSRSEFISKKHPTLS